MLVPEDGMTGKTPKKNGRPGVDRIGRTPLHYAALEGKLDEAKRLLTEGADPSARDDNGWTPLHFAAQSWQMEMASLLLSSGAPVDAQDSNGNTALCNAVFSSKGRGELIGLLRAHGADPRLENNHGISPLGLAKTIANHDVKQHFADLGT
jgi:ankyrin repeat protein